MTIRRIAETSPLFLARIGGLLYLLIIVGGLFAPFAVAPSGMMLGDGVVADSCKDHGVKIVVCPWGSDPADGVRVRCRGCTCLL